MHSYIVAVSYNYEKLAPVRNGWDKSSLGRNIAVMQVTTNLETAIKGAKDFIGRGMISHEERMVLIYELENSKLYPKDCLSWYGLTPPETAIVYFHWLGDKWLEKWRSEELRKQFTLH